eukprot:277519-Pyramimonas_sp.AAC.1
MVHSKLAAIIEPPDALAAAGLPTRAPDVLSIRAEPKKIWLRVPVEPKQLPKLPKQGCSRYPMNWDHVMDTILRAHDDDTLKMVWDAVVTGVEFEILNRYDVVDDEAA